MLEHIIKEEIWNHGVWCIWKHNCEDIRGHSAETKLWPVVARFFPANDFIFQDDNAPVHKGVANMRQDVLFSSATIFCTFV